MTKKFIQYHPRTLAEESGRTMLEMLGVLAIMGVIIYGAVAGIGFGVDVYKVNACYNEVEELAQGIIDLYSWSEDYSGLSSLTEAQFGNNDLLPSKVFTDSDNKVKFHGQYGSGSIMVTPIDNGQKFKITYGSLSELACTRLPNMDYKNVRAAKECSGDSLEFTSRD